MPSEKKSKCPDNQKRRAEPERVENLTRKSKDFNEPFERRNLDDAAEMFRGLFDGNEHYHSRDASFVSLFG